MILCWPHNPDTWPQRLSEAVRDYIPFIREIAESQKVWLIVQDFQMQIEVERLLILHGISRDTIRFIVYQTTDSWARDFGPLTLVRDVNGRRERLMTDWIFNGWGGKYYTGGYAGDDVFPQYLADVLGEEVCKIPHILEGGSIEVNGTGTLITSRSCLLNENRNSALTRNQIEETISSYLGVRKIIWVGEGISGDDTDGHIDDTVRFVNDETVVCAYEDNPNDENHEPLKNVYNELKISYLADGRPLRVIKLPMPVPFAIDGQRVPASYANFLITNDKVLVPVFKCAQDDKALGILRELFPTRHVVGIDCRIIVWGLGALHCLSMQVPGRAL